MKMVRMFLCYCVIVSAIAGVDAVRAQEVVPPDQSYKVLPGDVLQISVWREETLQQEVLVRPDGAFSFPLAGDISAKGRSVLDLQSELTSRLSRYISDPVVTVSVSEVLGNKVYVIHSVF